LEFEIGIWNWNLEIEIWNLEFLRNVPLTRDTKRQLIAPIKFEIPNSKFEIPNSKFQIRNSKFEFTSSLSQSPLSHPRLLV
jgi:hypothetical protein